MSIRAIAVRLIQNGRILLRSYKPHQNYSEVAEGVKLNIFPKGVAIESSPNPGSRASAIRNVGYQVHLHARRLFVDNVLKRVTNSLAADLRRKAAKRLLYGDSAPFFALVGVSLASGTGILTKDDQLEGICWEIREAVSKLQWDAVETDFGVEGISENEVVGLSSLILGPAIAKGCSAVVYAARKKPIVLSEVKDDDKRTTENFARDQTDSKTEETYPLAVKMMFNYDAESNATCILRAMYRETVPARSHFTNEELSSWEQSLADRMRSLPPHPNIVEMYCVFADRIPYLPESLSLYPDALPARINPQGYGRNMSLFLLMKRYDCSLKEYIQERQPSVRVAACLLAQLLEGVAHMNRHGIAHRDLKSDNILLDLSEGDSVCPLLVVTDFGCCLADRVHGLQLPYHSPDTDKGGNTALMAPEVASAQAGPFTSINYSKSDPWAVGAIAYELFGQTNPFYSSTRDKQPPLRNLTYSEDDLPQLPEPVPPLLANVVIGLLHRNPAKRLSAEMAATVCQLFLWAPSAWLRKEAPDMPSSNEILQWLLCLTTKVLCEGRRLPTSPTVLDTSTLSGRRSLPEYQLISSFLGRVKLRQIKDALSWIHSFNT
ncbi:serine/threonine-protein kinase Pink1, mitochondrial [Anabrus simplex]|uniref:serine/threonine-protein kinase Pink1, mitochondrial n=1 Tax=Anabrus simplex TaxID=316456 RepID=UPI0035A2618F